MSHFHIESFSHFQINQLIFKFYKYQGTGNDFVILNNSHNEFDFLSAAQIKFLCDRRFGIGGDGLMLLNNKPNYDFEMKYYNSDGAESTMCGNGGRCLVQFAADNGLIKDNYHFWAIDGEHEAIINDNGWIKLKMKNVDQVEHKDDDSILDTGSPHYVKLVTDVHNIEVYKEGKEIRYNKRFAEDGINVNFVEVQDRQIYVRTYERGVENETLSCGTGVTAAALVFAHNPLGFNHVDVETPGGKLAVEFKIKAKGIFYDIWLCGPATFVFSGEIEVNK